MPRGRPAHSGTPVGVHNVAAGVAATDAVNLAQLEDGIDAAVDIANNYTDARIEALDFDLSRVRKDARAGTAAALAAAGMPQVSDPGKSMIAAGVGTYRGRTAFALGFSYRSENGRAITKVGLTYDSSEHVGANAGVGLQF